MTTTLSSSTDSLIALENLAVLIRQHSDRLRHPPPHSNAAEHNESDAPSVSSDVLDAIASLQAATAELDVSLQARVKSMTHSLSTLNEYTRLLGTQFPEFTPTLQQVMCTPKRTATSVAEQGSGSPRTPGTHNTAASAADATGLCSPLLLPQTPLQPLTSPVRVSEGAVTPAIKSLLSTPAKQSVKAPARVSSHTAVQRPCASPGVSRYMASLAPVEPTTTTASPRPSRRSYLSQTFLANVDDFVRDQLVADGIPVEVPTHIPASEGDPAEDEGSIEALIRACEKVLIEIRQGLFAPLSHADLDLCRFGAEHDLFSPLYAVTQDCVSTGPPIADSNVSVTGVLPTPRYSDRFEAAACKQTVCARMIAARLLELKWCYMALLLLRHLAAVGYTTDRFQLSPQQAMSDATARATLLETLPLVFRLFHSWKLEIGNRDVPPEPSAPPLPPPLVSVEQLYAVLGYASLWPVASQEASTASPLPDTGSAADDERRLSLFVHAVTPFIALWSPTADPSTSSATALPRRAGSSAARGAQSSRDLLLLSPSLAPLVWREATCAYLQACARELVTWREISAGPITRARARPQGVLRMEEWLAEQQHHGTSRHLPLDSGLSSMIYPVGGHILNALSLLDQRGLLPCDELDDDDDDGDQSTGELSEASLTDTGVSSFSTRAAEAADRLARRFGEADMGPLPDSQHAESTTTTAAAPASGLNEDGEVHGQHDTSLRQYSSASANAPIHHFSGPPTHAPSTTADPSVASSSTFEGSSAAMRAASHAEASRSTDSAHRHSLASLVGEALAAVPSMFQSRTVLRTVAAGTVLPAHRNDPSTSFLCAAPQPNRARPRTDAVALELPHVSTVLRQESGHLHRSSFGHTLHLSVNKYIVSTSPALSGDARHKPCQPVAGFDLFSRRAHFAGADFSAILPRFHSTLLFCPVSRQRCVDPCVAGGAPGSEYRTCFHRQGVATADPHTNSPTAAAMTSRLGDLSMSEIQQLPFLRSGSLMPTTTRNVYAEPRGGESDAYTVPLNPPDLLECGHVLSDSTVKSLRVVPARHRANSAANRGQLVRCPYCSQESSIDKIITLSYLSN